MPIYYFHAVGPRHSRYPALAIHQGVTGHPDGIYYPRPVGYVRKPLSDRPEITITVPLPADTVAAIGAHVARGGHLQPQQHEAGLKIRVYDPPIPNDLETIGR